MNPPCDQCLKFAICIGNKQIMCNDFYEYFTKTYRQRKQELREDFSMTHLTESLENNAWDYAWDKAKEIFPDSNMFRTQLKGERT
jgi:hypothetical protein